MARVAPATGEVPAEDRMTRMFGKARTLYKLAETLDDGLVVHSKSFWKDLKLIIKEKHVVVSCWACHPESTFGRTERTAVLIISIFLGFLFAGLAEAEDEGGRTGIWIGGIIAQTFYDTLAKKLMKCACCKHCYACCQKCGEALANFTLYRGRQFCGLRSSSKALASWWSFFLMYKSLALLTSSLRGPWISFMKISEKISKSL